MTDDKAIGRLGRLFLQEKTLVAERDLTPTAQRLIQSRKAIATHLQTIGKRGDLDLILAAERHFLENDLAEYSNSKAMKDSLNKALLELGAAEKLLPTVRDLAAYRAIDEAHSLPKNRSPHRLENSVPYDEARQFFSSHDTRLVNMDKSRLAAEEKQIVEARKLNMRAAEKIYTRFQQQALGLAPKQEPGQGLSR